MDKEKISEIAITSFEQTINLVAQAAAGLDPSIPGYANNYRTQRQTLVTMLSAVAARAYELGFRDGEEFRKQIGNDVEGENNGTSD